MVQMKEGKGGGACHGVLVEVDEVSREDKGSQLAANNISRIEFDSITMFNNFDFSSTVRVWRS